MAARSPVARVLSLPWGSLMAARRAAYARGWLSSAGVAVPVVSVGNLGLGGTGKSPLIRHLAAACAAGHPHELSAVLPPLPAPLAVLSRGYGRRSRGWLLVSDGHGPLVDAADGGDEPVMLARQLPGVWVAVDEDRLAGARRLVELGARAILLDDGFQHRRLRRDTDLLLWDCAMDPSREAVLPFGRLREAPGAARAAHALLFARPSAERLRERLAWFEEQFAQDGRPLPPAFAVESLPGPLWDWAASRLRPTAGLGRHGVFCGIAAPERFLEQTARLLGAPAWTRCWGDHHRFTQADLEQLRRAVHDLRLGWLVTTWKDAVRLPADHGLPILAAGQELRIQAVETYLAHHG